MLCILWIKPRCSRITKSAPRQPQKTKSFTPLLVFKCNCLFADEDIPQPPHIRTVEFQSVASHVFLKGSGQASKGKHPAKSSWGFSPKEDPEREKGFFLRLLSPGILRGSQCQEPVHYSKGGGGGGGGGGWLWNRGAKREGCFFWTPIEASAIYHASVSLYSILQLTANCSITKDKSSMNYTVPGRRCPLAGLFMISLSLHFFFCFRGPWKTVFSLVFSLLH